jgi:hypothetical protein
LAGQCEKADVHSDRKAWFGVWPTGVTPLRPNAGPASLPHIVSSRKQKERCATANCRGFTANGCPYRLCATHCRSAGGCSKHKIMPTIISAQESLFPSSPLESTFSTSPSSGVGQFQSSQLLDNDVITAALEASMLDIPTSSGSMSYSSSSQTTLPVAPGSSSAPSTSPIVSRRPKISSQLGGAWLAVLDADAADKVEKEKLAIDKAEAASEARKSVDVIWYDQVRRVYTAQFISDFANKDFASANLFTFQGKNELPNSPTSMHVVTSSSLVTMSLPFSTTAPHAADGSTSVLHFCLPLRKGSPSFFNMTVSPKCHHLTKTGSMQTILSGL